MQDKLIDIVFPVLHQGIRLKQQVQRGEDLKFAEEQAKVTALLKGENEARVLPSYGGDGQFLGIRYALACWLDEIFCDESEWGKDWNENKRETTLYGTNDRGYKFWEQAAMAEARADRDALEGYYLCVMLGFRGDRMEQPDEIREWTKAVERQLWQGQAGEWPGPPALPDPPPDVDPLQGKSKLRRATVALLIVLGLAIVLFAFKVILELKN